MFPVSDVIPPRRKPAVTIALIALNTLVFSTSSRWIALNSTNWPMRSAPFRPTFHGHVPSRAHSCHDGWIHFAGNMLYLWIFGDNVEDAIGPSPVRGFLSDQRCARGGGARGTASVIRRTAHRGERRRRGDHGGLLRALPEIAGAHSGLPSPVGRDRSPGDHLPRRVARTADADRTRLDGNRGRGRRPRHRRICRRFRGRDCCGRRVARWGEDAGVGGESEVIRVGSEVRVR